MPKIMLLRDLHRDTAARFEKQQQNLSEIERTYALNKHFYGEVAARYAKKVSQYPTFLRGDGQLILTGIPANIQIPAFIMQLINVVYNALSMQFLNNASTKTSL